MVENSISAWKRYFPVGCCWWSRKALCDVPWWSSQGAEMWLITQRWYRRWPRARFPSTAPGSTDWDRRGNDGPAAQHKLHVAPTPTAPLKPKPTGSQQMTNRTFGTPNHLSEVRYPGRGSSQLICGGFVAPDLPAGDLCGDTESSKRGWGPCWGSSRDTFPTWSWLPPFYRCTPYQTAASGSIPSARDFGKFNPTNPLQFTKISLVMEVHHTTKAEFVFSVLWLIKSTSPYHLGTHYNECAKFPSPSPQKIVIWYNFMIEYFYKIICTNLSIYHYMQKDFLMRIL